VMMGCGQLSKAKREPLSEGGSDGLVSGLLCWDEIDREKVYACSRTRTEGG